MDTEKIRRSPLFVSNFLGLSCYVLSVLVVYAAKYQYLLIHTSAMLVMLLMILGSYYLSGATIISAKDEATSNVRQQVLIRIGALVTIIPLYYAVIYFAYYDIDNSFFNVPLLGTKPEKLNAIDFFYFSLATFTTVGFGDITAKATFLRAIVSLEILNGVAILVISIANIDAIIEYVKRKQNTTTPNSSTKHHGL